MSVGDSMSERFCRILACTLLGVTLAPGRGMAEDQVLPNVRLRPIAVPEVTQLPELRPTADAEDTSPANRDSESGTTATHDRPHSNADEKPFRPSRFAFRDDAVERKQGHRLLRPLRPMVRFAGAHPAATADSTRSDGTRSNSAHTEFNNAEEMILPEVIDLAASSEFADSHSSSEWPIVYRPLVTLAYQGASHQPMTNNSLVLERDMSSAEDWSPNHEIHDLGDHEVILFETYSDADERSLWWSQPLQIMTLPNSLLWQVPLANQREPRMAGKFMSLNGDFAIDTAVGGILGITRLAPDGRPFEGIQFDLYASVFTRFNDELLLTAADYIAGIPVSYAKGPWQFRFAFQHYSTHLGDEFIQATGARQRSYVRDELILSIGYVLWNRLRVYGQGAYSVHVRGIDPEDRDRWDFGVEWSRRCPTGPCGQPFAALDFDLRADQDYTANTTFQVGWQWRNRSRRSGRLGFEYYNGQSPYGQFSNIHEEWVAFAGYYDW